MRPVLPHNGIGREYRPVRGQQRTSRRLRLLMLTNARRRGLWLEPKNRRPQNRVCAEHHQHHHHGLERLLSDEQLRFDCGSRQVLHDHRDLQPTYRGGYNGTVSISDNGGASPHSRCPCWVTRACSDLREKAAESLGGETLRYPLCLEFLHFLVVKMDGGWRFFLTYIRRSDMLKVYDDFCSKPTLAAASPSG